VRKRDARYRAARKHDARKWPVHDRDPTTNANPNPKHKHNLGTENRLEHIQLTMPGDGKGPYKTHNGTIVPLRITKSKH